MLMYKKEGSEGKWGEVRGSEGKWGEIINVTLKNEEYDVSKLASLNEDVFN